MDLLGPARSHLSAAQCSNGELHSTSFTVPESRPWYEWSTHAEPLVLDMCERCGPEVCNVVKDCFAFAPSFDSDTAVAAQTKLLHVFYNGSKWHKSPVRKGIEVGWHDLLFQLLYHHVWADLDDYRKKLDPNAALPRPTVLIMPLSRSAIPLT